MKQVSRAVAAATGFFLLACTPSMPNCSGSTNPPNTQTPVVSGSPQKKADPAYDTATRANTDSTPEILLNPFIQRTRASSAYEKKHPAAHAFDGDCGTAWNAKVQPNVVPWVEIEFDVPRHISKISLTPGWERINKKGQDLYMLNLQARKVTVFLDGVELRSQAANLEQRLLEIDRINKDAKKVRLRFDSFWPGAMYEDAAVSDIMIFGTGTPTGTEVLSAPRCDLEVKKRFEKEDPKTAYDTRDAVCGRLTKRAQLVFDKFDRQIAQRYTSDSRNFKTWKKSIATFTRCSNAGNGAWMLLPFDISFNIAPDDSGSEYTSLSGKYFIVFVGADGMAHVASQVFDLQNTPFADWDSYDNTPEVTLPNDWDGDGVKELVLDRSDQYENGGISIWTLIGETVAPYRGAAKLSIEYLEDYDKDGRTDIVSIERWRIDPDEGPEYDPPSYGNPSVLYHSLADGTFTASDDEAKAYLRNQCKKANVPLLQAKDYDGIFLNIACTRLRGKSAKEVKALLKEEWQALSPSQRAQYQATLVTLSDFLSWAAIEPPCTI
ncbi:MAG: discoidin domain-containing protein [Deltaproteobacteria bacterium]|nr:discoidin domain-containing protein [Deltaproteobacteria bacterium]